jgi:putative oxidoreductase
MSEDLGKLVLRLALGALMLMHGVAKLRGGVDPIAGMVTGAGLPAVVTYGVYVGEVLAPLLVIVGWYASIGAILIAINMVFAIGLAHRADLLALGPAGGWALELQGFYLATAIAVALLGPGSYSVNRR